MSTPSTFDGIRARGRVLEISHGRMAANIEKATAKSQFKQTISRLVRDDLTDAKIIAKQSFGGRERRHGCSKSAPSSFN